MKRAVVIDIGWFRQPDMEGFIGSDVDNTFARLPAAVSRDEALKAALSEPHRFGLRTPLALFEAIVVTETIVMDSIACRLAGFQIPPALATVVRLRTPPPDAYEAAEDRARSLRRDFMHADLAAPTRRRALEQLMRQIEDASSANPFWNHEDKVLHDRMFRENMRAFADSNDTIGRVLFYLEFSRLLGDVPLLSPAKAAWFDLLGETARKSVHEWLVAQVRDEVVVDIEKALTDVWRPIGPPMPPVAAMILRDAATRRTSLTEAALTVRETSQAKSYRGYLAELKDAVMANGASAELATARLLRQVTSVAKKWRETGDPRVGVDYERRGVVLEKLPYVGDLLKAVALDKYEMRDWLLTKPPGYLAFVSSWFVRPARHAS